MARTPACNSLLSFALVRNVKQTDTYVVRLLIVFQAIYYSMKMAMT